MKGGEGEIGSRRGWNLVVVVVVVVIFSLAFLGIFSRRIRTGLEEEVKSLANRYYLGTRRQPLDDPAGSAMENSYVERHESGGPGETIEDSRPSVGASVLRPAVTSTRTTAASCYNKFATMLTL